VHARLVLEHLPDPSVALTATLVAALRPEGWLLLESSDPKCSRSHAPTRSSPGYVGQQAPKRIVGSRGSTHPISLGRTLPRRLRNAGLTDVNAEVTFNLGG
jgi:hypothetical protein